MQLSEIGDSKADYCWAFLAILCPSLAGNVCLSAKCINLSPCSYSQRIRGREGGASHNQLEMKQVISKRNPTEGGLKGGGRRVGRHSW